MVKALEAQSGGPVVVIVAQLCLDTYRLRLGPCVCGIIAQELSKAKGGNRAGPAHRRPHDQKAADAVDFADEDELIDDDEGAEEAEEAARKAPLPVAM